MCRRCLDDDCQPESEAEYCKRHVYCRPEEFQFSESYQQSAENKEDSMNKHKISVASALLMIASLSIAACGGASTTAPTTAPTAVPVQPTAAPAQPTVAPTAAPTAAPTTAPAGPVTLNIWQPWGPDGGKGPGL